MALQTAEGGVAVPPAAAPEPCPPPVLLQVAGTRVLVHAVGGEEGAARLVASGQLLREAEVDALDDEEGWQWPSRCDDSASSRQN